MKPFIWIVLLLPLIMGARFMPLSEKTKWVYLFNGKNLNNWNTYIGPDLNDDGKMITGQPIGLNKDPRHVFSIVKVNDENVIRISGENWGAISTIKEYADYHLQLMFKWGELTWGQKKKKKKDSGLLYHSVGENGADYGAWMRSQEFQIEQGNCGDYWGVAGGTEDIPAIKNPDNTYTYDPGAELHLFSSKSKEGRHCVKKGDAEKPEGEWNTAELYCHGDTSVHVINGKVMMVLYHSGQLENEQTIPLIKGKIQIQSEGAEVFYKKIRIQHISKIPQSLLK